MQSASYEFLGVLGFAYLQHSQAEKAATVFQTLNHLQPDNALVVRSLTYSWLLLKKFEAALELSERWIAKTADSDPNWKHLQMIRGRALYGLGRESEAISSMQTAMKKFRRG